MHIQPGRSLSLGDTDIMGSVEFNEAFQVYVRLIVKFIRVEWR